RLAAPITGGVRLWDLTTAKPVLTLRGPGNVLMFDPTGTRLYGSDGKVAWETPREEIPATPGRTPRTSVGKKALSVGDHLTAALEFVDQMRFTGRVAKNKGNDVLQKQTEDTLKRAISEFNSNQSLEESLRKAQDQVMKLKERAPRKQKLADQAIKELESAA